MTLRPALAADAEALARLHARAFPQGWSAHEIAGFMQGHGGYALAAVDGSGQLTGFILCRAIAGEAEVLTLAVDPDHRRQGLGRALVEAAAALAAPTCEALFLEVAEDNLAAIRLYQGAGFDRVGVRHDYYEHPEGRRDAIVMRRDLNSAHHGPYGGR